MMHKALRINPDPRPPIGAALKCIKRYAIYIRNAWVLLVALFTLPCYATTYYVDGTSGNDSNSGTTLSQAWRTIGKANSMVQPGDTVYLGVGTYRETVRPGRSGTDGNPITYMSYPNKHDATITGNLIGANLEDRDYIIIDGLKITDTGRDWVVMRNSDHNVVQNCYMDSTLANVYAGMAIVAGANYNKISNNMLYGGNWPRDIIFVERTASHNVIEGNDVRYGNHYGINVNFDSYYNVVRNNRVWNPWHASLGTYENSDWTLFEGNIVLDSGEDYENNTDGYDRDRAMGRDHQAGMQTCASHFISRNNVVINSGLGQVTGSGASVISKYNHIYANTYVQNYYGFRVNGYTADTIYTENVVKNNIFYKHVKKALYYEVWPPSGVRVKNYYINNNIFGSGDGAVYHRNNNPEFDSLYHTTISEMQSTFPAEWYGNRERDPLFVNPEAIEVVNYPWNRDFNPEWLHLQSISPMIDAGAFLTTTRSAGNGTVIEVEDTGYFYDGWGIPGEKGDLIQLEGQNQTARITSIDYANNRITVDRSLTWSAGQGVSLPYSGAAPDIGAFEYQAAVLYGDVSENGKVSAYDASLTAQYTVGNIDLTETQKTKADVTGNSQVSATDASWIAKKVVDPSVVFPMEQR